MLHHLLSRSIGFLALAAVVALTTIATPAPATAAEPIRIGLGISLTGPLAANGKSALLAMKIWEEDVNAKGGLLGRPVKLVYYDDQSNPSTVPGIYTKLLDVDKVDLVVGPYGTNMIAPAMPVIIQYKMTFIGLLGLAVNSAFNYPNYFAMIPSGPSPKEAFTKGFYDIALAQNPKPKTVAIVGAVSEKPKGRTGTRTSGQAQPPGIADMSAPCDSPPRWSARPSWEKGIGSNRRPQRCRPLHLPHRSTGSASS